MSRVVIAFGFLSLGAGACLAATLKPVENKGLSVERAIHRSSGSEKVLSTKIFLQLMNPNDTSVDVRNVRCEFHDGDKLVKQFSIARLTVKPGENKYEAPQTVDGSFNRALCKLGK
ncbi:hypothetical protein [Microvirga puerhi]|uniref:Uncharacterized protein n=1 Tax=Microvirga puerhi TaxID=2876078 RepID=A0ABS7VPL4_9HYPH|nr:hypothetical protein [Microvirga puerhi]MBZ6077496.1 hypothetical protein [Microvirga puerhi]